MDDKLEVACIKHLIQCLKYVLELSAFQFNSRIFLQTKGSAMGTRVALSSACLTMGRLEEKFLDSAPIKPIVWLRYIDDIFAIWTNGEDSLNEFTTHINQSHPTLKFTCEQSTTRLNFLDVTVLLNDNKLSVELFTKRTDTHNYLHYSSAHSPSCRNAIPYGHILRVKRNCTNNSTFEENR